ncbi:MAG TPA: protein-L-isoaspartate(D-aspartate) O-methyltransferase [Gammaproteobacteria bacterium]|nr:protein-L-isoaspartate(D-aspartate) O-methyltransferase [Gammaproteobacteria bacterium]|tara:strand:- start:496 stop:1155 length:660 start_codon:yes stop_codon:yes gene_type:complete
MTADLRGIGMTSQRARDRLVAQIRSMGVGSEQVLELIGTTPRHLFVDEALASRAYENNALPIGLGQTISQPYIVAVMTEALLSRGKIVKALEIGAGCGYQSVILARVAQTVYSVERIGALASKLRIRLHELHVNNVRVRHDDGSLGWDRYAPYDAILVAAAAIGIPSALTDQLAVGGRLVIPVGPPGNQKLMLVTKTASGLEEQILELVRFVPMVDGVT